MSPGYCFELERVRSLKLLQPIALAPDSKVLKAVGAAERLTTEDKPSPWSRKTWQTTP